MDYNIDEEADEEQYYKAKYFKYKSKYLALKKQPNSRIQSSNIDNDNDLYYQQKYFKYKSKYLDIKYGGTKKQQLPNKIAKHTGNIYTGNITKNSDLPEEQTFVQGMQNRKKFEAQQAQTDKDIAKRNITINNNKQILLKDLKKIINSSVSNSDETKSEIVKCFKTKEARKFWSIKKTTIFGKTIGGDDIYYNYCSEYYNGDINQIFDNELGDNKNYKYNDKFESNISNITKLDMCNILDNPLKRAMEVINKTQTKKANYFKSTKSISELKNYIIEKLEKVYDPFYGKIYFHNG
jgi:hypothetical protein